MPICSSPAMSYANASAVAVVRLHGPLRAPLDNALECRHNAQNYLLSNTTPHVTPVRLPVMSWPYSTSSSRGTNHHWIPRLAPGLPWGLVGGHWRSG